MTTANARDPVWAGGAVGDGVTDNTSVLAAMVTAGVKEFVFPAGTFVVGDFALPSDNCVVRGYNNNDTILKAKAGATYVLDVTSRRNTTISDLTIDGNSLASKGVRFKGGTAVTGSERNALERVRVINCSTGIDVVTAAVDQVDKNTFFRVYVAGCTVGMSVNSINAQQQLMLQSHFEACGTSVVLTNGSLEMIDGQIGQASGTGILLNGTTIQWVDLQDLIFEGCDIGIDGNTNWPINGVTLRNVVVDGGTHTVRMGAGLASGSVLYAENARFIRGPLTLATPAGVFHDEYCVFQSGGTINITGANFSRQGHGILPLAGIASAATITIPHGTHVAQISGTTQINTITAAGMIGQTVTLAFTSTPTVGHNFNNIFLNGAANFVATANDTLTLFCNGSNWYEVGRAVI